MCPPLQVDSLPSEPSGKPKNTGLGRLFFLQWIFPTQELNWDLLHGRQILYQLSTREEVYSLLYPQCYAAEDYRWLEENLKLIL